MKINVYWLYENMPLYTKMYMLHVQRQLCGGELRDTLLHGALAPSDDDQDDDRCIEVFFDEHPLVLGLPILTEPGATGPGTARGSPSGHRVTIGALKMAALDLLYMACRASKDSFLR